MIEGKSLRVYFKSRDVLVKALDGVNVSVKDKEIVGIVGESGSGKTTLGRTILNLQRPDSGEVLWNGKNVFKLKGKEEKEFRRQNQIIYQNPYEAVDIRLKVYDIVAEGLRVHNIPKNREEERKIVLDTLRDVGLTPEEEYAKSLPNQLSGGQLQRVAIARALVLNPSFMVADEPVSMLDMSIRAGVLDIFKRLRDERGISIMMITHDISTLGYVADRIYVMYQGKVIEHGSTDAVLDKPLHPYTQGLISAVPIPDPSGRASLFSVKVKEETEPYNGKGCKYYPKCPFAMASCRKKNQNYRVYPVTTTSHASYTEERSLVTRKELIFSTIFVIAGGFVGILTSPELFLVILPLSVSVLLFKEWKLFRGMRELQRTGVLRFEPRFKTNRKEANRSLVVVLLLIATPMVLSFFLPPLPWLAITMAIVMSWPASNLLEGMTQLTIEKRTGKKLRKFYTWTSFRDDVVMKDYGWSLK